MPDLPRYTSLASFEEVSEFARDVLDYLEAQPQLLELTASIKGGESFRLALSRRTPPRAILVTLAEETLTRGTFATPSAVPGWTWTQASGGAKRGEVNVTSVTGLTTGTQYNLRLLVIG